MSRGRPVGSREDEVVGESGRGDGHVGLGFVCPFFRHVGAVLADDGVLGAMRDIKACGADDDVAFEKLAVFGVHTLFGDPGDAAVGQTTVGFGEGLEVAWSWGDTTAPDFPFGDELGAELRIMIELLGHLLSAELHCSFIVFAFQKL